MVSKYKLIQLLRMTNSIDPNVCSYKVGCHFIDVDDAIVCDNHGTIHRCDQMCRYIVNIQCIPTCTVSGKCFEPGMMGSSFRCNVEQTSHIKSRKRRTKHTNKRNAESSGIMSTATTTKIRRRKNNVNGHNARVIDQFSVYVTVCKLLKDRSSNEVPVNESNGIMTIDTNPNDRFSTYSKLVHNLWNFLSVIDAPSCTFKEFTVGCLFTLQYGLTVEEVVLFNTDQFLLDNLPQIPTLPSHGIKKNAVRTGTNYMLRAVNVAWKRDKDGFIKKMSQLSPDVVEKDNTLIRVSSDAIE